MRTTLVAIFGAIFGVLALAGQLPLRQNLEILKEGPIRADKVKEGLYVIRGPFLPCMTGCRPGQTGDGLIHESGDVAVRVTPAGLIVVDDKFASQAADVLAQVKAVSTLPIKYLLNSHHHGDHVSGNAYMRETLGDRHHRAQEHPRELPADQAGGRAEHHVRRSGRRVSRRRRSAAVLVRPRTHQRRHGDLLSRI